MVSSAYHSIVALAEIAGDEKKTPHFSDVRNYELNFTKTLPPTVMDRLSIYQSELLSKTGAFKPPSEGQSSPYPDLFQVLNTPRTLIGKATILRSIMQPLNSIPLIEAKQESLKELESWPDLEKALSNYIEALAKDARLLELLFSARNPGPRVNIMRLMRKLTSYFRLIVASSETLPNSESPYLKDLIQQVRAIPKTVAGKLILSGMYVTWGGKALTKSEAKWHQQIHKYVPYPITGKISIPGSILASCALLSTSTNLKSLLGLISVPMLLSAMAIAFGRAESDYQDAFVPLSRRCIEDTDFLLAIDAIGKIEELLAFREFKRRITYQTSLPTFLNDRRYTLNAKGFLNPVMAATDNDLVANDIKLNDAKPFVLTGFNSSAKTSTGQGLVFNQILAQMGCYVAASKAEVSCASRIYYQGHRTAHGEEGEFGTDLAITRDIVFAATPVDLVILDEPCRGTSHAENSQLGMRILRALAMKGVTTFVTTHNLSMVEQLREEGIINPLMIEIREDKATFRIVPGIATSSGAEQIAKRLGFSNEDVDSHLRNKLT
jgi:DNA mismatch repair protein MutS